MDRESAIAVLELEVRHSAKLLKARHRIENARTGWIGRFDLANRNRKGVLYGDYMTGRFFGVERTLKTYGPWRGWSLQVSGRRWRRPARFANKNLTLFQVGPFVLFGPVGYTCRT